jgi:hypothetical protein
MLRFLLVPATVLLAGCGYIGDPLPPLANMPLRVNDLAAVQRGARIIVQFTVPDKTTEGHPIPAPAKADLRAGAAEQFEENDWAEHARQIPPVPVDNHIAHYEIPAAEWTGREIIFGVRIIAGNGKQSGWSNFVVVPVVPAPVPPSALSAVAAAGGVNLTWSTASNAPGAEFRVFRKVEDADFTLAATVQKPEWLDTAAEFGKHYSYTVQAIYKQDTKVAESDLSEAVSLTPVDRFPPAIPVGLHASTAPNSIELNWEPNTEPDLAAYRVYRAIAGGLFEKVAEVTALPSYSDRAAEHGKTYRYAVTALDRSGNESPRSPVLEVVVP